MKKQRSKLPIVLLSVLILAVIGSIALGFMTLTPASRVIEQSVTLPLSAS